MAVRLVLSIAGIFHDIPQLHHSDNKLGGVLIPPSSDFFTERWPTFGDPSLLYLSNIRRDATHPKVQNMLTESKLPLHILPIAPSVCARIAFGLIAALHLTPFDNK